ncbi:3-ketoacyl-ACP reductase [Bacillus glycinifermentans]|uniref:3-ketoacyl-ACP reductase n=1 Tax=Bacillus glycinifermentans TaxID=1664069 RepID=A0A0J6EFX4_9BACI|nr:SDR family oxidoreductase [Bacillus glycinifermentans]ATH91481.1 3-oxoacyl-ACP reductase [Bacillus glycinifermentans]KMM52016.1 3-ketoacyl-ACP reductase [Bacillus glycinifermentans]KRT93905.1 3-ketoacyl-ACP reductase [Bacillus glycinifermentans]MEC0485197.1 SDR family oxidoreductase [Bacillus glycinifermentans]MEC0495617.1 SDR family oxidoreductase [Bacillus glycinifermentans]
MTKLALVTGASGGIGQSICEKLAQSGFDLLLHYNTNEKAAVSLSGRLSNTYRIQTEIIQSDLSDPGGAAAVSACIGGRALDAVVLNSGQSYRGLVTDMTDEEAHEMVQLHVTSPFTLTRNVLPAMIRRKAGAIVAITSIWGETGASCEVLYSMTKGAQHSFVKALAKELAPSGIRVNAVSPGAVKTNMMSGFSDKEEDMIAEDIPMGRLAKPDEVADAVQFLLSEKASYITGQILSVNGGWHC